jgi:hypothetical protein
LSNQNRPFGLRFIGMLSGAPANVRITRYRVNDSNAVYIGDPVERVTSGSSVSAAGVNQVDGTPFCKRAGGADNQNILGVVIGLAYDPTNLNLRYITAAAAALYQNDVYVIDDPNALFEIQSDVTGIAYTDVGKNAIMTVTAGDTTTGISKCVATGPTADASYPLLIVGLSKDPKNDITSAAYSKVVVRINIPQLVVGSNSGTFTAALGV